MENNQGFMKKCPYCAEEILLDAVKCRYCGEWIDESKKPTFATAPINKKNKYSYAQRPGRLVFLTIISIQFYEIYWHYRTWKQLKFERNLDIMPFWRTVGTFIPIINYFIVFSLFNRIKILGEEEGNKTYSYPGFLSFVYATIWDVFFILTLINYNHEPMSFRLVIFSIFFSIIIMLAEISFIVVVQMTLNSIWEKKQPELKIREEFSDGEIILIVVGVLLWIFWFFARLLGL